MDPDGYGNWAIPTMAKHTITKGACLEKTREMRLR